MQIRINLVALACATALCFPALGAETTEVALHGYSCSAGAGGIRLPEKLSAVRALGVKVPEEVGESQQWDGYSTTERTLGLDGMTLQVITFSNDPERFLLSMAIIESARWDLSVIRVGQQLKQAFAALGYSGKPTNGNWRFNGESESLYVEARAGKISRLVFECYTG